MNLDDISVQKGCGISQKAADSLRASLVTLKEGIVGRGIACHELTLP